MVVDFDRDSRYYRPAGFAPDLVKLDVEGKEVSAIRGAERLLTQRKPHMIVETHSEDLDAACRSLLMEHGYAVETVEPRRWVPEVRTATLNRWCIARGEPRRG
jgi:Methyltransferase FkbM domain